MMKVCVGFALLLVALVTVSCKEEDERNECIAKGGVWIYQHSGKTSRQIGCIDPKAMIKLES